MPIISSLMDFFKPDSVAEHGDRRMIGGPIPAKQNPKVPADDPPSIELRAYLLSVDNAGNIKFETTTHVAGKKFWSQVESKVLLPREPIIDANRLQLRAIAYELMTQVSQPEIMRTRMLTELNDKIQAEAKKYLTLGANLRKALDGHD